ncbi:MAG: endolytic transglycosylase MltG [Patescibacteria group bacterium]|nr:endolytic transglycosylase MltG [Patescibacteria group bacterium]MDE2173059.1 endolytic transglycosylase MltG [Patescibacteria group bacterium]
MGFLERLSLATFSALQFHFLRFFRQWVAVLASIILFFGAGYFLLAPPQFTGIKTIVIAQGASLRTVAGELADAHVISYPLVLRLLLQGSGEDSHIQAGAYRFDAPENLLLVMHTIITAGYSIPPVRITFPEGATVRDMAARIAEALPSISATDFLASGQPYEGYLFPDTYHFSSSADVSSILRAMRANFTAKTTPLTGEIIASGHSLSDAVIMASLLEKEARTSVVRRMISGILWNRLQRGMPLQVDAVFGYIYGRDTYAPSLTDLRVNSPYNTYTHKGLPPGPIDNPGLDSLEAAIHPTPTKYLYYLTDKEGVMHYATTYAAHEANRRKYLQPY